MAAIMSIRQLLRNPSRKWSPYIGLRKATGCLQYETKNQTPQSRNYSSEEVTWLWKVNDQVKGFTEAAKHGTRVGMAEHTFNSVKPLEPEHFHQALDFLMRKFPNLRTVVRNKDGEPWYCQLHNYTTDFEILSNEDTFRRDCFDLLGNGFNESDALPWRARVLPRSPDAPCNIEGVKKSHPYQYDFTFMSNHNVIDATDGVKLCSCIYYALDCIVGGIPYGDKEYGIFENNTDFEVLVDQRKKELLQDPTRFRAIKESLPVLGNPPSIIQAFPRPNVLKPNTKNLQRIVNPLMMTGLLSKCKQMGVTFSSFAISACNIALTELMEEAGMVRDIHELYTLIFMNSRRYRNVKRYLMGCYITALTYKTELSSSMKGSFWDYCKHVNHDLLTSYNEKGLVFDQTAVQAILDAEQGAFNYTDNLRPVSHDYSSNYLGDITKIFPKGDYVKLTNFIMLQKYHNYRNALVQEISTFEGTTQANFQYDDNYFSEEVIELIVDRIFHVYEVVGK